MTSMIKPEVKPGERTVPLQRAAAKSGRAVALASAAPAAEPLLDTAPTGLSAKDAFCLGVAFSAVLLVFGGGAAAAIDDGVPPQPQTGITAR